MNTKLLSMIFLITLAVVCAVVMVPLALIWALNTLFPPLSIPVTWATWGAMLLLAAVFTAGASK